MPTEIDARQMWCPFARIVSRRPGQPAGVNRNSDGGLEDACQCVASGCMAWRWENPNACPHPKYIAYDGQDAWQREEEPDVRPDTVPADYVWMPPDDSPGGWQEPAAARDRFERERLGFCGLAGHPAR